MVVSNSQIWYPPVYIGQFSKIKKRSFHGSYIFHLFVLLCHLVAVVFILNIHPKYFPITTMLGNKGCFLIKVGPMSPFDLELFGLFKVGNTYSKNRYQNLNQFVDQICHEDILSRPILGCLDR